ncbi:hypothetical protein [Bartonella raoultii]|uniref:Uncharacterized protein n=1 Tax=Bartonella raoultii TaxID=1457020 RepID=A0ABS7IA31_9HYPH|nr:hypothetical protein [Bartonella raoultii]MBX4336458.1 hypothetical protein [Bartonella raoultii]
MTSLSTDLDPVPIDHSQTFADMVTLIQDEIDDTTAEYTVQIQDSIEIALRLCQRELFFFNEKKQEIFKTQSGKTWYGQEDGVVLESERALQAVFLGTQAETQLFFKSAELLQQQYGVRPIQGIPLFYTVLEHKIGLFPTPKEVEIVRLSYDIYRLRDKTSRLEEDPWLFYAFDLIKARAKYELYKNILKDPEYAAVSFRDFQEQVQALRIETSRRRASSNILPTRF